MKKELHIIFIVMLCCTMLIGGLLPVNAQTQSNRNGEIQKVLAQWSTLAPMPGPKIYHSSAYYKGSVFVFGGTAGSVGNLDIYKYDVAKNSWSVVAQLPEIRNYSTADVVGDKIYLMGGYSQISLPFTLCTQVLVFDPVTSGLDFSKSNIPTPVAGHASVVIGNKIFLLGGMAKNGWANDYQNLVQIYDPATDTWASGTAMPVALRNMAAGAVGNTIITAGGFNSTTPPTSKADVYRGEVSGTTITWTKKSDYPAGGLSRVCGGSSDTKVYFTGGQQVSVYVAKTYSYNLATDAWESLQDKPTPIHSGSKLVYDGSGFLYCPGGQVASGSSTVFEALATVTQPFIRLSTAQVIATLQVNTSKKINVGIKNTGSADLTWNATIEPASVKWAILSPASGTIPADNSSSTGITISTNGLAVGDYTATIKVTSNDPDPSRSTLQVPINLKVQTDPPDVVKRYLLEEFTGTWCPWCPYGADSVTAILQRYPDEVTAISYHNSDALSTPIESAIETFLKVPYYPGGFINRMAFWKDPNVDNDRFQWSHFIDSMRIAGDRSPLAITISNKIYNPKNKQMSLRVNVRFIQTTPGPLRLNLAQTESGLNYGQNKANSTPSYIYPYYHQHALRLLLPDIKGDLITASTPMQAGEVFTKDYTFTSKDSLPDKCEFVAFVHKSNGTTVGDVVQSSEEEMLFGAQILSDIGVIPAPTEFSLTQNFPNPFNPSTTISYTIPKNSFVTIKVYNVLGKQVATLVNEIKEPGSYSVNWDAKGMSSGMYYYKLESGSTSLTKSMTLLK